MVLWFITKYTMKTKLLILLLVLPFVFNIISCNDKDNDVIEDSYLEEFVSLEAEADTLHYMDTTKVVATAIGNKLTYEWETSSNAPIIPIEGKISEVYFYADPCVSTGAKIIYCKVKASNREETKKDTIVIVY